MEKKKLIAVAAKTEIKGRVPDLDRVPDDYESLLMVLIAETWVTIYLNNDHSSVSVLESYLRDLIKLIRMRDYTVELNGTSVTFEAYKWETICEGVVDNPIPFNSGWVCFRGGYDGKDN